MGAWQCCCKATLDYENKYHTCLQEGQEGESLCPGLGWYRANFLCRGSCGAVLWIFDENRVDNTGMF